MTSPSRNVFIIKTGPSRSERLPSQADASQKVTDAGEASMAEAVISSEPSAGQPGASLLFHGFPVLKSPFAGDCLHTAQFLIHLFALTL